MKGGWKGEGEIKTQKMTYLNLPITCNTHMHMYTPIPSLTIKALLWVCPHIAEVRAAQLHSEP